MKDFFIREGTLWFPWICIVSKLVMFDAVFTWRVKKNDPHRILHVYIHRRMIKQLLMRGRRDGHVWLEHPLFFLCCTKSPFDKSEIEIKGRTWGEGGREERRNITKKIPHGVLNRHIARLRFCLSIGLPCLNDCKFPQRIRYRVPDHTASRPEITEGIFALLEYILYTWYVFGLSNTWRTKSNSAWVPILPTEIPTKWNHLDSYQPIRYSPGFVFTLVFNFYPCETNRWLVYAIGGSDLSMKDTKWVIVRTLSFTYCFCPGRELSL